ncbi:kinase-like protein, partial [Glonium stellatum]
MDPVAERDLGDYLENLDDTRFDEEGYLFREQLPQWFGCLVSGVHYLHSNGIRHRDIKPRNILILSGNVLLADFGISKSSPGESLSISTDTGGTPKYRAPEVVEFQRFGRKSDIFSLG